MNGGVRPSYFVVMAYNFGTVIGWCSFVIALVVSYLQVSVHSTASISPNALFGYLAFLIVLKWCQGSKPDLYHVMIYMFLSPLDALGESAILGTDCCSGMLLLYHCSLWLLHYSLLERVL